MGLGRSLIPSAAAHWRARRAAEAAPRGPAPGESLLAVAAQAETGDEAADRVRDAYLTTFADQIARQDERARLLAAQAAARRGAAHYVKGPAAEKRPGPRPDPQGGPTHAS